MRRPVQELFGDYQNNLYAAAFNVCVQECGGCKGCSSGYLHSILLIKKRILTASSTYVHGFLEWRLTEQRI